MTESDRTRTGVNRRDFLAGVAAGVTAAAAGGALAQPASVGHIPIIDSHIHLFDGTRPVFGKGYLGSRAYAARYKKSLPSMYAPLARSAGIVGAIVVQSSFWVDENLWYLEQCRANPIMVGVCGTLDPASADFGQYVGHFHNDPLFRAIRVWRFYDSDAGKVRLKPDQVANLRLLAQADLALDTANPSLDLMQANVLLADAIPSLRIIMDHLPAFDPTPQNQPLYESLVKQMAARPNIFVKLTEAYHPRADGVIVKDYAPLRERLELLYDAFGEDRVMFGTDYPNSYGVATIPQEVSLAKRFMATQSRAAAEKFLWKNSARVYKWVRRLPSQPDPT
ncbi:MAG: amidohydrolase family protein [Steroidobacteraceae bacterium]